MIQFHGLYRVSFAQIWYVSGCWHDDVANKKQTDITMAYTLCKLQASDISLTGVYAREQDNNEKDNIFMEELKGCI